jgi:hypothetical protein
MTLTDFTSTNSLAAARLSGGAAAAFVILLAALHLIRPDLDPSWRFISEYEIGDFGWLMSLAFLSLAVSYVALFIAVRPQLRGIGGYIGLVCLLISAAGLTLAAIFTTDPITTNPDAMTTSGQLHSLGGTLGFAMPFASVLVSWSLARHPAWSSARQPLLWAAGLTAIGFLASIVSLMTLIPGDGHFGPDVPVGWPLRFEIVTYCVWLIVTAWQALQVRSARAMQTTP